MFSAGVGDVVPHIAIPTTAGTGSEVTNFAVIMNESERVDGKVLFIGDDYAPVLAILDPNTIASLPAGLTASTGMDALTHAIEATVSLNHNHLADAMATHAVQLIVRNLGDCIEDGSNLVARSAMQNAAAMAGWAFQSAGTGLVHAMAHALGAKCGVPHGTANGVLLPVIMEFNLESCVAQMAMVGLALGASKAGGASETELAAAAPEAVRQLMRATNHPTRLGELGVKQESLASCIPLAMADPAGFANPRPFTPEQVSELFLAAF